MRFFDLHCDTLYRMKMEKGNIYENNFHVSIKRSLNYKPYIGCFAAWIPDDLQGDSALNFFKSCKEVLYLQENIYKNDFKICRSREDLESVLDSKKQGIIFTVEGSRALNGDLRNVEYISKCGVKIVTLTWNGRTEAGDGAEVLNAGGLTNFGKKLVKELERYNIIIDISHASEKLFYDVFSIAQKPFIATHSNSKHICNHRRNLTDDQFKCIKDKGGIIGITFCGKFLNDSGQATFEDILRHIEYFLSLGGEDVVSIGSDFDGAEVAGDLNDLNSIKDLYEYFLIKNYKESLLDKIFFSNAYNLIKRFY